MSKIRILSIILVVIVLLATTGSVPAHSPRHFHALLSSAQEVADPPVVSDARGLVVFRLNKDGTQLTYSLFVSRIEDVQAAHIHTGAAGTNGAVVAWLYPDAPPAQLIPGRFHGVLARGTITADDLVGPLAGQSLSELVSLMQAGNAYVNVHTAQYPSGEIRGQIR